MAYPKGKPKSALCRIIKRLRAESFIRPGLKEPCLVWEGSKNKGYGLVRVEGKLWRVHRAVYFAHYPETAFSTNVLHRCDNPSCAELTHLFAGTPADNARDRKRKGRNGVSRGEANSRAKLTSCDVRRLRKLAQRGINQQHIAAEFGVSQSLVSDIVTGKVWRHLS